jgi:glucose/arabinose dehydrogenase
MSKKKVFLIVIGLILLVVLAFVGLWVKNNTSLFTNKISDQELAQNNLNKDANYQLVEQVVDGKKLNVPNGFTMTVFARDIGSARFMTTGPDNTIYAGTKDNDNIYAIKDTNGDGVADYANVIEAGLNSPHSVFYYKNDLYLGEENRVSVYRGIKPDGSFDTKDILVDDLPAGNRLTGGGHKTRTVVIGPDEKLYVSVGSSCNVCIEDDERRATIMRYDLNGQNGEIFATGLRNTVGFDFLGNEIYGADMGRDQIGDDIPPEEINIIKQGKDYGWPYCYGDGIFNPEFPDKQEFCANQTEKPFFNMQAHSAPLDLKFVPENVKQKWPTAYQSGMLVALHGSWNRTVPTGYKVVWIDTSGERPKQYNFLSGWLGQNAEAWGRPVGFTFDSQGSLYISDDKQNLIYKLTPQLNN